MLTSEVPFLLDSLQIFQYWHVSIFCQKQTSQEVKMLIFLKYGIKNNRKK